MQASNLGCEMMVSVWGSNFVILAIENVDFATKNNIILKSILDLPFIRL
jgi:hypothetical protein